MSDYRSIFVSDFHLGSRHCQAKRLLDFLKSNSADKYYLVGDVIDNQTFLGSWPAHHNAVLIYLAQCAAKGSEVIYTPGNHDEVFSHHIGRYGNLVIANHWVHHCKDGRKLLVTHGHETDMIGLGHFLALLVLLERFIPITFWEVLRKYFGKTIKNHTIKFQRKMLRASSGYAGIICGHVHFPQLSPAYMNCGDWVHHCTAIVEHHEGKFELLKG
jgi:UDP-2,3-diacylglucosamine pyrophosphatase LpxH